MAHVNTYHVYIPDKNGSGNLTKAASINLDSYKNDPMLEALNIVIGQGHVKEEGFAFVVNAIPNGTGRIYQIEKINQPIFKARLV